MNLLNFIPSFVSLLLALFSLPLLYVPASEKERQMWEQMNIRYLRHWVTKHGTEKWDQKGTLQNIIERSRKNIAWHAICTFTFFFLMVRAQFIDSAVIQYGSHVFVLPSIGYFIGSIIQRQKLVVMIIHKQKSLRQNPQPASSIGTE
ncbi:MAG: hypothetical protein EHM64_04455 [Ignavibacteriae bacterium]|nr:MAG: hypothetical protein EHM64_04455 [Ignavibacteriota bacterium]